MGPHRRGLLWRRSRSTMSQRTPPESASSRALFVSPAGPSAPPNPPEPKPDPAAVRKRNGVPPQHEPRGQGQHATGAECTNVAPTRSRRRSATGCGCCPRRLFDFGQIVDANTHDERNPTYSLTDVVNGLLVDTECDLLPSEIVSLRPKESGPSCAPIPTHRRGRPWRGRPWRGDPLKRGRAGQFSRLLHRLDPPWLPHPPPLGPLLILLLGPPDPWLLHPPALDPLLGFVVPLLLRNSPHHEPDCLRAGV